jgi:hypothetical protein
MATERTIQKAAEFTNNRHDVLRLRQKRLIGNRRDFRDFAS